MFSRFWFLFLLFPLNSDAVQTSFASFANLEHDWNLNALPNPNATGHLVFDTVSSLLQHWPNTRWHSGAPSRLYLYLVFINIVKATQSSLVQYQLGHFCIMGGQTILFQLDPNGPRLTLNLHACSAIIFRAGFSQWLQRGRYACCILTAVARRKILRDRWTPKIYSPGALSYRNAPRSPGNTNAWSACVTWETRWVSTRL
jgi:hypothetical protein